MFIATMALPWLAVGSSRASVFADIALMGAGLGLRCCRCCWPSSTRCAVRTRRRHVPQPVRSQHRRRRRRGNHGSHSGRGNGRISTGVLASLDREGLAGLSPELKHLLIVSLQRAFTTGAVAAGLALVTAFWVPPFAGSVHANAEMLAEMTPSAPEAEPTV